MRGPWLFPDGAAPPSRLTLVGVDMSQLGIDDLAPDFAAVVESAPRLKGLFDAADAWPDGLTEREDLIDLAWHEREFRTATSFAWSLRRARKAGDAAGGERYLGSAYLYRDPTGAADLHAVHWIRAGEADPQLRERFAAAWEAFARAQAAHLGQGASLRFSSA